MLDHGWFRGPLRNALGDGWNWRARRLRITSCPRKLKWGVRFYARTLMAQARQETIFISDTEERYRQLDRQQLAAEKLHRATIRLRFIERDAANV